MTGQRHTLQRWLSRAALAGACVLLQAGCASLPPPQAREPDHAFAAPQTTPLGKLAVAASTAASAPGVSGFRLLVDGGEAFGTLAALTDRAQRSLDLQYYLIHSDGSSRALIQRVRAAADRGVKVRLLVDDLNTSGQDAGFLRLTAHPNIELRIYNPFPAGRASTISRVLTSITDITRINQRMHNKMFVADNALAVTGGRNLGDAYYVESQDSNFLDIDLIVAGPAVRTLSATFDAFWNNPLAYPIAAIAGTEPIAPLPAEASPQTAASATDATASAATLSASADKVAPGPSSTESVTAIPSEGFARELAQGQLNLVWASSHVLADQPSKIGNEGELTSNQAIADDVESLMRSAKKEVILMSPYFVPGERGVALITSLVQRGVKVRILTNSLATTDAPAVHIGYARYRVPLLEQGIELYELRPHLNATRRTRIGAFGSSQASLHAKVLVVDGATSLVGSMNMDPRSEKLNTEMGVVVRSTVISKQLAQTYQDLSTSAYRLSLTADKTVQWTASGINAPPASTDEPEASLWLKLGLKLLAPFAPDEML